MSRQASLGTAAEVGRTAPVFAALGDATRLRLLTRLGTEGPASIARLTEGTGMSRQAVTKHLQVLADAGLVRGRRDGRQSSWELQPDRLAEARRSLELISRQWDETLSRLKAFVED